jgi:hypothetical protein
MCNEDYREWKFSEALQDAALCIQIASERWNMVVQCGGRSVMSRGLNR